MEQKLEVAKTMVKEGKSKAEINSVLAATFGKGLGNSVFARVRKEVLGTPLSARSNQLLEAGMADTKAGRVAKPTANFDALVKAQEEATEKKPRRAKAKVKKLIRRRRRVSARTAKIAPPPLSALNPAPVVRRRRRARAVPSIEHTAALLRGLVIMKVPFTFDGKHLQLPV
jgi:hypothetical protein